jgi:hypothetical protein
MKGGELLPRQNALQATWITELKEQLAVMTKRKICRCKHIQHDGTLEYRATAMQVGAAASVAA